MEVDKSWIHLTFPDEKFMKGVLEFVKFAKANHRNKNVIACPCGDCKNQGPALDHRTVMLHCFQHGFDTTYKFWFVHGEKERNDRSSTRRSSFEENTHDLNDAFNIIVDNLSPDGLDTMLNDDSDEMADEENLVDDVEFNKNLHEAMSELYPESVGFSVLRFVVKLFNLKIAHGWTNQSFTELLQLLDIVLPHGNKVVDDSIGKECELLPSGRSQRAVAKGFVMDVDPNTVFADRKLGDGNFKVYVDVVYEPNTRLPFPHDGWSKTFEDIVPGPVIWPKNFLKFSSSSMS